MVSHMVLSDGQIRERIERDSIIIDPFIGNNVEPASVDLRLGDEFREITGASHKPVVDTHDNEKALRYSAQTDEITLQPEDFVLATTLERVELPDDIAANVLGRSSLGRLGISIHQTAGWVDPGFKGEVVLELSNHGPVPVRLHSGDRIAQIVFHELEEPVERPYGHSGSQYQNQSGATPSGMKFD